MHTYIVGDLQGCYDALRRVLDMAGFDPDHDQLWSVGDVVNRGPDSLAVLRYLKSLGPRFQMVLGNHDLHLLAIAYQSRSPKKSDTVDAVLKASDRDELIAWLRQQPLIYQNGNIVLVHAGIPHIWSLSKALALAAEVEQALRGDDCAEFLEAMYGNEPNCWSKHLSGMERLRVITNYLTRMRICKADGTLDLAFKLPPDQAPKHYAPWFSFYPKHDSVSANKKSADVFFGHWAALPAGVYQRHFNALDSGYFWGGELTLLRLADKKRFIYRHP